MYLIQVVDTNSNTNWQTVQIQISWLQKPTDLDLHCLQKQNISGFSRTRVNVKCINREQTEPHILLPFYLMEFTIRIGTSYLLTILVLKFEIVHSTIGIKHGFSCINIPQVMWEVLKTKAGGIISCTISFRLFIDVSQTQFPRTMLVLGPGSTHLVTAANLWPRTIILKVA